MLKTYHFFRSLSTVFKKQNIPLYQCIKHGYDTAGVIVERNNDVLSYVCRLANICPQLSEKNNGPRLPVEDLVDVFLHFQDSLVPNMYNKLFKDILSNC